MENTTQKHWFVYKLYGFFCCAYQNKQKIKSSLGLGEFTGFLTKI
jgi:hypothetical protein